MQRGCRPKPGRIPYQPCPFNPRTCSELRRVKRMSKEAAVPLCSPVTDRAGTDPSGLWPLLRRFYGVLCGGPERCTAPGSAAGSPAAGRRSAAEGIVPAPRVGSVVWSGQCRDRRGLRGTWGRGVRLCDSRGSGTV